MTKNLTEQIETTSDLLAQLETEQGDFKNRMAHAATNADSASIISLRHRADDLPLHIRAARLRLERLRLSRDEIKLDEIRDEPNRLAEPMQDAVKRYNEARDAKNEAVAAHAQAQNEIYNLQMQNAARKRAISALEFEMNSTGLPIVRSRVHSN
jgi:chromosome segregation ATPase